MRIAITHSSFFRAALVACSIVALAAPSVSNPGETAPVSKMVNAAIAGNTTQLERAMLQVRDQPKPPRGDRRLARELNERGLAFWQRQRFAEAATLFKQAHDADASDAEIAENLGYALLKSGQIERAQAALLEALTLGPERASAWGSLGLVYAKEGKHREGIACVLTAYRFARDKKRTLDVYSRLAQSDEDPKVRALLTEIVARLTSAQADRS